MDESLNENKAAGAPSGLNVGLGLLSRIEAHLRQLSPHMLQREGVGLLREARVEIDRLREVIGSIKLALDMGIPADEVLDENSPIMDAIRDMRTPPNVSYTPK